MFTTGIYNLLKATHICRHDYYHIIYHIILCLRSDSSFVSQATPYWKLHAEGWNNLSTHAPVWQCSCWLSDFRDRVLQPHDHGLPVNIWVSWGQRSNLKEFNVFLFINRILILWSSVRISAREVSEFFHRFPYGNSQSGIGWESGLLNLFYMFGEGQRVGAWLSYFYFIVHFSGDIVLFELIFYAFKFQSLLNSQSLKDHSIVQ